MAYWQRTLNLLPEWNQAKEEITLQKLAEVVAVRLNKLEPFEDDNIETERKYLVNAFELLADAPDLEADSFDDYMEDLYDWADQSLNNEWPPDKVCWVKIF